MEQDTCWLALISGFMAWLTKAQHSVWIKISAIYIKEQWTQRHTRALKNLCCKFYTIYCPKLYYWLPYTTLGCTLHSLFQAPGPQNWLKHEHENKMRGDWGEPPPPSPTVIFSPAFHLRVTPQSESLEQAIQFSILYYTKLHYTTLHCVCYCVMLCYAMLYTILRYMPYYAMSCHPMPCYAILYQNNLLYPWKKISPCRPWAMIACRIRTRRVLFGIASLVFFILDDTIFFCDSYSGTDLYGN